MVIKLTKKQKREHYGQEDFREHNIYRRLRWQTVNEYGWQGKPKQPLVAKLIKPESKNEQAV